MPWAGNPPFARMPMKPIVFELFANLERLAGTK
jgi:hypothetical protein